MATVSVEGFLAGYCKRSGIGTPAPREDGSWLLHFDGSYDVVFSDDGRNRLLLRHDLPTLARDRTRQDVLRHLLHINLALSGRKQSTLSLDRKTDTPFLYDLVSLDLAELGSGFAAVVGFVNEVAAFHRGIERGHQF